MRLRPLPPLPPPEVQGTRGAPQRARALEYYWTNRIDAGSSVQLCGCHARAARRTIKGFCVVIVQRGLFPRPSQCCTTARVLPVVGSWWQGFVYINVMEFLFRMAARATLSVYYELFVVELRESAWPSCGFRRALVLLRGPRSWPARCGQRRAAVQIEAHRGVRRAVSRTRCAAGAPACTRAGPRSIPIPRTAGFVAPPSTRS